MSTVLPSLFLVHAHSPDISHPLLQAQVGLPGPPQHLQLPTPPALHPDSCTVAYCPDWGRTRSRAGAGRPGAEPAKKAHQDQARFPA